MTHLRVIEGGAGDGPAPIVWNRAPLAGAIRALVLLDDEADSSGWVLAYDVGEPVLVGIRSLPATAAGAAILGHWLAAARGQGHQVDDRRTLSPATGEALRDQLEDLAARRAARRRHQPLPAGGLFA